MPRTRAKKGDFGAKATFVRANPKTPANELIGLAKKAGIALTAGYIYNIRSTDKRRQAEEGEPAAMSTAPAVRSVAPTNGGHRGSPSSSEAELRSLLIRVGLDRAETIFTDLKESLRA